MNCLVFQLCFIKKNATQKLYQAPKAIEIAYINLPLSAMQISELLQFEQMPAAVVPKDVCYQDAPRVREQANKGKEPCMGPVLYHFCAAPAEVIRFEICMEQILQK